MPKSEIPSHRVIERKELISLFNAMKPGEEITPEEIHLRTGLDIRQSGDRNLCWQVREHCCQVIGFCVDYTKTGNLRRETDIGVVTGVLPKRRQRIYGQVKRGVAESMAIADFSALPRNAQVALLSYQSTLETLALASQASTIERTSSAIGARTRLEVLAPEMVLSAVQAIKQ